MGDNEVKLWRSLIHVGAIIVLSLIWSVAIYNYIDRAGPVRPVQTMQYYWPK